MIKDLIRTVGQKLLGFDRYLFLFSLLNTTRMRFGGYEKEFRYFMQLVPSQGTVLDIGANIGIMTVALARKFPAAHICAIEPVPANTRALQRVIHFYKLTNVRILAVALGNSNGPVQMVMPLRNNARMQGLTHVVDEKEVPVGEIISVPMHRLDDEPTINASPRITGIKIDVENFEWYVLQGGEQLIRKHRPVIYCELWNDARRSACIAFITHLGYRVMVYQEGRLVTFNGQPAINFFFLPG